MSSKGRGAESVDDTEYWRGLTYSGWLDLAHKQAARFWSKVTKSEGCWLWAAGVDKDGYGKFQINGRGARFRGDKQYQKTVRSHRLAWDLKNGPVPAGLLVLHSCDTPACCNPDHLAPGTQKANREQAALRGRTAKGPVFREKMRARSLRGERHPHAMLNDDLVRKIRALGSNGARGADIARRLSLPVDVIYQVLAKKTWSHVS